MTTKRIWFNTSAESYGLNYIMSAKAWNKFEGRYYSGNGYVWDALGGLLESETELQQFQSSPYPITPDPPFAEAPTLLDVGVSSGKMYWIECNSGWLFEYRSDTDYLQQKYRLYVADGMKATGQALKPTIKPLIVDGILYRNVKR